MQSLSEAAARALVQLPSKAQSLNSPPTGMAVGYTLVLERSSLPGGDAKSLLSFEAKVLTGWIQTPSQVALE
jgi:hypothetical protein